MTNLSHKVLRDIDDIELAFEQPLDEDLLSRIGKNLFALASMITGQDSDKFSASANGNPVAGLLTMDTITGGLFVRDDQYNTSYILVTSGSASGAGVDSRFKITDSDESAQTFTCAVNEVGDDLQTAGMIDGDTFEVIGHVHDGTDGEKISADDIDYTNFTPVIKPYTASGRSQSNTISGNDDFTISHTITGLPDSGDFIMFGFFTIRLAENSSQGVATFTMNSKVVRVKHDSSESIEVGAGGGLGFIVSNGDTVEIVIDQNSGGSSFGEFDLQAYSKVSA